MQKLILLFALVTCSLTAPLEKVKEPSQFADLIRPSPINPDIPSDPKPEEKITLITDAEVKPAVPLKPVKLPGPYVLPRESLLRAKREPKHSSESDEDSSEEVKKPSHPLAASPASLLDNKATKTSTTPVLSSTHSNDGTTSGAGALPTATIPTHPRKPYTPQIHQHNEHLFKPTTEAHLSASSSSSASSTPKSPIVASTQDHVNDKRDIPVPLTRKFHHDNDDDEIKHKEEPSSIKVQKEEVKQEEEKNEGHIKTDPIAAAAAQHQAAIAHPIPVAELFAKKPSTE